MPNPNPYSAASDRLAARLSEAEEKAKKAKGVPFGMTKVTADVEAQAFEHMNREEKAKFMAQHANRDDPSGLAYTMKVIQRGQKNGNA